MVRGKKGDWKAIRQEMIELDKQLSAILDMGGNEESNCFECLVKEVGIQVKGEWQQYFLLFGTKIQGLDHLRND